MVEEALGELVFRGLVTADSFTGLRALITPLSKTTHRQVEMRRRRKKQVYGMDDAGRWVRLRRDRRQMRLQRKSPVDRESIEAVAQSLLTRYGVIFRKLLDRESISISWRDLLALRRLEARGRFAADASSADSQVNNLRPLKRCNYCDRFAGRR